jgi:hypothetical protein
MTSVQRIIRGSAALVVLGVTSACSGAGGIGDVLGGVLGGGQPQAAEAQGAIRGVDTRAQQISLQLTNGQTVALAYDNQTKVVYNNQSYPVTSLDRGDQVTARIQSTNNGYYTDLVQVDQPVQGSNTSASSGNVQTLQGTVRAVDTQNGLFAMDVGTGTRLTVSMPYSPSRADVNRFQSLRQGDYVRIAGVYLNNSRVELRQFY